MTADPHTLAPLADAGLVDEVSAYLAAVDELAGSRKVLRLANRAATSVDVAVLALAELVALDPTNARHVDALERVRAVARHTDAARAIAHANTGAVLRSAADAGLVDQALALVDDPSRPPTHKPTGRRCTATRRDQQLCEAYALPWSPRPVCAKHATPEERAHNAERRAAWEASR